MRCGVSLRGPPQMPLSSGTFWWWLAMDSRCSENRESFYVGWWPIKGAILALGRLKCLSVIRRVISQSLQSNCPGAAQVDKAALHIGAVAFIHRFGSSLNGHVHLHVCVVVGVFEEVPSQGDADADVQSSPPGIVFHPASAIDATAVAQVQTDLRRRILRAFVGRGLIEQGAAAALLRPPALCHGPPAQGGMRFGVPLRQTT
jgi:hypothetical protein